MQGTINFWVEEALEALQVAEHKSPPDTFVDEAPLVWEIKKTGIDVMTASNVLEGYKAVEIVSPQEL